MDRFPVYEQLDQTVQELNFLALILNTIYGLSYLWDLNTQVYPIAVTLVVSRIFCLLSMMIVHHYLDFTACLKWCSRYCIGQAPLQILLITMVLSTAATITFEMALISTIETVLLVAEGGLLLHIFRVSRRAHQAPLTPTPTESEEGSSAVEPQLLG